jgi:hypothetical protein
VHAPLRLSRRAIAGLATAALATPLLLTAPALAETGSANDPVPQKQSAAAKGDKLSPNLDNNTDAEPAKRHNYAFQRFADTHGGNRAAGSLGHEWSAKYAGNLLERAGYDVTYQYFDFLYREPVAESLTQLTPERRDIDISLMSYTASTPEGGIEAELVEVPVDPETGAGGCTPEEFDGGDYTGKIALIKRGACTFASKQANATAAGAVGAIIYNNGEGALNGTLGDPNAGLVPTGGITLADGQALSDALAAGFLAGISLGNWYPELSNCFLIAVTEKRTKEEIYDFARTLRGEALESRSGRLIL